MPVGSYSSFAECQIDIKRKLRQKHPNIGEKELEEQSGAICATIERRTREAKLSLDDVVDIFLAKQYPSMIRILKADDQSEISKISITTNKDQVVIPAILKNVDAVEVSGIKVIFPEGSFPNPPLPSSLAPQEEVPFELIIDSNKSVNESIIITGEYEIVQYN